MQTAKQTAWISGKLSSAYVFSIPDHLHNLITGVKFAHVFLFVLLSVLLIVLLVHACLLTGIKNYQRIAPPAQV
jgi:hypothetical protein